MLEETSRLCTVQFHRRSLRLLPLQCHAPFGTEVRTWLQYATDILNLQRVGLGKLKVSPLDLVPENDRGRRRLFLDQSHWSRLKV